LTEPIASVTGPQLRALDRFLRWWRIRKVRRYIASGANVLDIGCHDGALFRILADRVARGVGLDPLVARSETRGRFRFVAGTFPADLDTHERFDVITLLAVLEHVEPAELPGWREACERLVAPGGLVVATVPSPLVDKLLHVLTRLKLVTGMSVEEHHGFDPSTIPALFASGALRSIARRRFELGMNNLFVFRNVQA
jgi:2-polyprenyl-3-methyl-5-hydroxy-6-metoxy-1,4-benzoquinol methylase